jgi:hypothetical protein
VKRPVEDTFTPLLFMSRKQHPEKVSGRFYFRELRFACAVITPEFV